MMPGGVTFARRRSGGRRADAIVLVTEWPEFSSSTGARWPGRCGDLVVDGRNALDPDVVRAPGLVDQGIGRPQ